MKLLTQTLGKFLTFDGSVEELPGVRTFRFRPAARITWKAGQYYVYYMTGDLLDRRTPLRPFTVSSAPQTGHLQITTRIQEHPSPFKRRLLELKPGERVYAFGPFGSFTNIAGTGRPAVWLAGGIGITPFWAKLNELAAAGPLPDITLLYSSSGEVLFRKELDRLAAAHPKFKVRYATGNNRIDSAAIRRFVPVPTAALYSISGPKPMVQALAKVLRTELQIPARQIKRDSFKGYPWPLS